MIQGPVRYYRRVRARQMLSDAEALARNGQIDKAVAAFDLTAGLAGGDLVLRRAALSSVVDLLDRSGRVAEAGDRAEHLASIASDDPDAILRLARAREASGRRKDAGDAWLRRLELAPDDDMARHRLAALMDGPAALPYQRWSAEQSPDDAEIWPRLASSLEAVGDSAGAVEAWRRALLLAPKNSTASDRLVALLPAADRVAEFARIRLEIATRLATDLEAWRGAAQALVAADDKAATEHAWRKVLDLAPNDQEAHGALGLHYLTTGRPAEAVSHLRLDAAASGTGKALRRLALAEDRAGDEAAAASWGRLLEIAPNDDQAMRRLSAIHLAKGDPAGAISMLNRLLAQSPDDASLWRALAAAENARGDKQAAVSALLTAHKLTPRDAAILNDLTKVLRELGDTETLLPYLSLAAEIEPKRTDLHRTLARLLTEMGRPERAELAYQQVIELEPEDIEANRFLGMRAYELGRRSEAAGRLKVIARYAPTDLKLWRRLAWCLRNSDGGDDIAEIETLQHLLTLNSDDEEVLARLVELLVSAKRRAEAAPLLARLIALRPDDVRSRIWLARTQTVLGEEAAALQAWREVLALNRSEPEANTYVGEALLAAGDVAGAADHFAAAAPAAVKPTAAWVRVAQLRRDLGDVAGEITALQQIVAFGVVINMDTHRRLAGLLAAAGRFGEATASLELLLDSDPDDAALVRRLALAHQANHEAEAEAEAWRRRAVLVPGDIEAHLRLARLALDAGAASQALEHLSIVPSHAAPAALWAELARGLHAEGVAEGELSAWRRVVAADPGDLDAHERIVDLLTTRGEGAAAEPHLKALIAARPEDHKNHERLALILSGLGRKAEAAEQFGFVVRERPATPKPWKRWARLLAETGDLQGALDAWRHVLTLGADEQEARENVALLLQRLGRFDEAATYLRGLSGAMADGLSRAEQRRTWLGGLNPALTRAELKVLDVGARGGPLSWMSALAPFAHYYACEPEAEEADRLTAALLVGDPWRGLTMVREGLGKTAGELTLHQTEHPGFSSVYPPNPEMAARYGLAREMTKTSEATIPVITLAEAATRYAFEDLGFLKVDTQGSELDVLKGGEAILKESVQAIFLEAEFREFYKGQPLFSDVERYLRGLGFELVRMEPVGRRRTTPGDALAYSRHELLWAHALFVKRAPDAKKLQPAVFLKRSLQQILVALAYEMFDLVADLAFSEPMQAALAAEGLTFDRADLDTYIAQALGSALLRDFEERHPVQVKSIPKAYTT